MTTPTIAEIAAGLTKAQREAVIGAREFSPLVYPENLFEVNAGGATRALYRKQIIKECEFRGLTGRPRRGWKLTPLGLAVRDHLRAGLGSDDADHSGYAEVRDG